MYGTSVPSLGSTPKSRYGFVNETQVRVGAGLMVTLGLIIFLTTYFTKNYMFGMIGVSTFWLDFLLKVINPRFSFFGIIAQQLGKKEKPIWVGAIQKRFAWIIGLVMSTTVLALFIEHNFFGEPRMPITMIVPIFCVICLIFMRLEAHLGLCVGCKIFAYLTKNGIIKNNDRQTCADGSCSLS